MGTATAYVASGQVDDPNTAATSTGDLTATRYYTFGGSTVAIRTNDGNLSLMMGDEQGSTNVVMPVHVVADGNGTTAHLAPATLADAAAITRTSYTPYGELRGADNTATDRGWLGQVEDRVNGATGTGLTYLNARYYDPTTMRFISPDPLVDPGDPVTLDPYQYAANNPIVFTDASGLSYCTDSHGYPKPCPSKLTPTNAAATPAPSPKKSNLTPYYGTGTQQTKSPSSGGSGNGTTIVPSIPFTPGPAVPPIGTGGDNPFKPDCSSSWDKAGSCGLHGLDGYREAQRQIEKRLSKIGRYITREVMPQWARVVRRTVFGSTGKKAVAIGSHLDSYGPASEALGFVFSWVDSESRIHDLGADGHLSINEEGAYVVSRWLSGEVGSALGSYGGSYVGVQSSGICGPAVEVCAPFFAAAGSIVGGVSGDGAGTWAFDHLLGGDAFLRRKSVSFSGGGAGGW